MLHDVWETCLRQPEFHHLDLAVLGREAHCDFPLTALA